MWARHEAAGRALQDGLEKLGLELWAAEGHRLPELTTVVVPDGVDDAAVRRALLEDYGIEIGAGAGPSPPRCGGSADGPQRHHGHVTLLLAALAEVLGR